MSSDRLHPLDPVFLLRLLLGDKQPATGTSGEAKGAAVTSRGVFPLSGLSGAFMPSPDDPFRLTLFGHELETPLGAAAGPHTQLCGNIVAAWLAGARFLELKTVQVLDDLKIAKPCINARDEGYNCEWSQELSLEESCREYLHAWGLIHVLRHALGHPSAPGGDVAGGPGFLFNISAGYDLAGIRSAKMTKFLDHMADATDDLGALRERLTKVYPAAATLPMGSCLSDNLTLSTMHGCPPDEIERMGRYFLEERGLHTVIKLNPTLLGPETVRGLLNDRLGWPVRVPDEAFAHDLRYDDAVKLIHNLQACARKAGRDFRVKLTNTLPTVNAGVLPASEANVYLSGRALHPLAVELARKLQETFRGKLEISFSAGVDADNVADCADCGLAPLTTCTDLLRPGGYGRLTGMMDALPLSRATHKNSETLSNRTTGVNTAGGNEVAAKANGVPAAERLVRLTAYAAHCAQADGPYARAAHHAPRPLSRKLPRFDCAAAPCQEVCPSDLRQPAYLRPYAKGDGKAARQSLVLTNPLHHMQAAFCETVCRHKCEKYCSRAKVDAPVNIQMIRAMVQLECPLPARPFLGRVQVLVRGDGVAGLTCASFLIRMGVPVMVERSTQAQHANRKQGEALEAGLTQDQAVLVHRGVVFVEPPVEVSEPLPENALIYVTADAASEVSAEGALQKKHTGTVLSCANEEELHEASVFHGLALTDGPGSLLAARREGLFAAQTILARYGLALPLLPSSETREEFHTRRNLCSTPAEVESRAPTAAQARREAARCLQCDRFCGLCATACPNRALLALPSPQQSMPVLRLFANGPGATAQNIAPSISDIAQDSTEDASWEIFSWRTCLDSAQIVHLADLCNECGHCATICPSGSSCENKRSDTVCPAGDLAVPSVALTDAATANAPYRVKPHIHLSETSFIEAQNAACSQESGHLGIANNEYLLEGPEALRAQRPGFFARLFRDGDTLRYEDDACTAVFQADTLNPLGAAWKAGIRREGEHELADAAEMLLLFRLCAPLFRALS